MTTNETSKETASPVILAMRYSYSTLSEAEQKIVDYLLSNPDMVIYLSVKELAERIGVSVATIVRTSKKLGYKGFSDLKINLAQENATTIGVLHREIQEEVNEGDDILTVFDKILNSFVQTLHLTRSIADAAELERAAHAICNARKVVLFGVGGSAGSVAADANHKFMRLGIDSNYYSDTHIQTTQATFLKSGDVAIGISTSGRSRDTREALMTAKSYGATTICITDFSKSTIVKAADIKLYTSSPESKFKRVAQASRIAQLCIIDTLYTYVAFQKKDAALLGILNVVKEIEKNKKA